MRRVAALLPVLAVACETPPARTPFATPIAPELLCSARSESRPEGDPPAPRCIAAGAPRIERLRRDVLTQWRSDRTGDAQIEFSLDPGGKAVNACVVGGTSDEFARAILAALAAYEPTRPLTPAEAECFARTPLVATFSLRRSP